MTIPYRLSSKASSRVVQTRLASRDPRNAGPSPRAKAAPNHIGNAPSAIPMIVIPERDEYVPTMASIQEPFLAQRASDPAEKGREGREAAER